MTSSTDFDDVSLFEGLQQDANKYIEDHKNYDDSNSPIAYLDDGSYWLRLYPEILERDGKKRARIIRLFTAHSGFPNTRKLPCEGSSCRICKITDPMQALDEKNAWKYQAREEALIKAIVYKSSVKSDYVKLNSPLFIVLRWKGIQAIQQFIADLAPQDLQKVLDPTKAAPMLKITVDSGSKSNWSVGFDINSAAMPELPADFATLDTAYVKDTDFAKDDELQKVRTFAAEFIAKKTNLFTPDDQNSGGVPGSSGAQSEETPKTETGVSSATNSSTEAASNSDCPGASEGLKFGEHPGNSFTCVMCSKEPACIEATKNASK